LTVLPLKTANGQFFIYFSLIKTRKARHIAGAKQEAGASLSGSQALIDAHGNFPGRSWLTNTIDITQYRLKFKKNQ
jgi:hypothetical protein